MVSRSVALLLLAQPTAALDISRRAALKVAGSATAALSVPLGPIWPALAVSAAAAPTLRSAWTATDGFGDSSKSFIAFEESSYAAMRDDERRTPLFEKAIQQRLAAAEPNTLTVLDVGTGPYALLALAAARAGAKKVYTIEANAEAAKRARDVIRKASDVRYGTIEVIEGFSTVIELPEKVDLLVAEIAGSVASEEGAYASIRDAQARFMKRPSDPKAYIPYNIQTFAAPASYALHYALGTAAHSAQRTAHSAQRTARSAQRTAHSAQRTVAATRQHIATR